MRDLRASTGRRHRGAQARLAEVGEDWAVSVVGRRRCEDVGEQRVRQGHPAAGAVRVLPNGCGSGRARRRCRRQSSATISPTRTPVSASVVRASRNRWRDTVVMLATALALGGSISTRCDRGRRIAGLRAGVPAQCASVVEYAAERP